MKDKKSQEEIIQVFNSMRNEHEQHLGRLQREKETNKETEGQIQAEERQLIKIRESLQGCDEEVKVSEGQVAILANQLSAFATEL